MTSLSRLDPFFDVREFMRRGFESPDASFAPSLDLVERESDILVRVEVPGVDPDEVEVNVHDGILTVSGERTVEHTEEGEKWIRRETTYGSFERRVTLPKDVDAETVSADYKNGVLEISVPKPTKAVPKKVEVRVNK